MHLCRKIDVVRLFAFLFIVVCISACSTDYKVPADKIRIHIGAEPATLNPVTASDAYSSQVNNYLFDSFLKRNYDTLDWEPQMAEKWTISEDKKTFTFYLKKNIKWHDGKPFTADDVMFSYNLLMDEKTNAPALKSYFKDVERIEKVDDYTVAFHYKKVYFLALGVCNMVPLLPKHIVEKYDDFEASPYSRHPIGMGPYVFKEWVTNTKIILERNEDYYGVKPEIKTIEFKVIPDAAIGLQILKKGELDIYSLSSIQWARQTGTKKFAQGFFKFAYPSPGYSYIGWNQRNWIFADKKVRRAMTHLINRHEMNLKMEFGLGKIITGPFFPFSKQYNKDIKPLKHDVNQARMLLKDAGWADTNKDGVLDKDGKPFKFVFLYPSASKTTERISTIMKEDLEKIGIVMEIQRMEWAAFLDKIQKRDFEATMLGWGSPFEGDPYQVWHKSGVEEANSSNFISYVTDEGSELIEKARVEFDQDKRNDIYWRFHEILHEDQPYTFMFNKPTLVVVSRRFDNVKVHKAGLDILEWKVKH